MLYAFALTNSIGRILYKLKTPDHCYIVWDNNIDHYLNILLHDQPQYILGMGEYSGIDQEAIRIETVTTNRFRNNSIEPSVKYLKRLKLNNFLESKDDNAKIASTLGNSRCNLVSWKIMKLINSGALKSHYAFLHVPNKFPSHQTVRLIEQMLK